MYIIGGDRMNMTNVSSSNLQSVGFDKINNILRIQFLSGGLYDYLDIPFTLYEGLMNAESKGKYFDTHIKKGGYHFNKIN